MADHLIPLPGNYHYVYQFDGGSQYKCVEACLSMACQVAYPNRYPDPKKLMSQIYTQYVGPDVPGDRNGTTKAQAIEWLQSQHIGYIDMDVSDLNALHDHLQQMNLAGIPQIISIGDESFLKHAKTGHTLHNWADALNHGSHAMLRVGYSDSDPWGYYYEPAAAPNFGEPVPIAWQDFLDGHVVSCLAIFPHGVSQWPLPPPKPTFDKANALSTIHSLLTAADAFKLAVSTLEADINALL